jgi:hypothetical protein
MEFRLDGCRAAKSNLVLCGKPEIMAMNDKLIKVDGDGSGIWEYVS